MPAKTQDIRVVLDIADNLYEAVLMMARRARQLNDEMYQKKRDRQILEELEGGFEDDFVAMDPDDRDIKNAAEDEDNPVTHALTEFLDRRLEKQNSSGQ